MDTGVLKIDHDRAQYYHAYLEVEKRLKNLRGQGLGTVVMGTADDAEPNTETEPPRIEKLEKEMKEIIDEMNSSEILEETKKAISKRWAECNKELIELLEKEREKIEEEMKAYEIPKRIQNPSGKWAECKRKLIELLEKEMEQIKIQRRLYVTPELNSELCQRWMDR